MASEDKQVFSSEDSSLAEIQRNARVMVEKYALGYVSSFFNLFKRFWGDPSAKFPTLREIQDWYNDFLTEITNTVKVPLAPLHFDFSSEGDVQEIIAINQQRLDDAYLYASQAYVHWLKVLGFPVPHLNTISAPVIIPPPPGASALHRLYGC